MTSVLIVEDESALVRLIRDYLVHDGFRVMAAGDAATAMQRFKQDEPDLIVLDLGLPDRNGLDVTREIRRTSTTPIIILTARGEETDRVVVRTITWSNRSVPRNWWRASGRFCGASRHGRWKLSSLRSAIS